MVAVVVPLFPESREVLDDSEPSVSIERLDLQTAEMPQCTDMSNAVVQQKIHDALQRIDEGQRQKISVYYGLQGEEPKQQAEEAADNERVLNELAVDGNENGLRDFETLERLFLEAGRLACSSGADPDTLRQLMKSPKSPSSSLKLLESE